MLQYILIKELLQRAQERGEDPDIRIVTNTAQVLWTTVIKGHHIAQRVVSTVNPLDQEGVFKQPATHDTQDVTMAARLLA